jgi:hypothetical protein
VAPELASLLRAGGSAMMALVGIGALVFARRDRGALALGTYLTSFGVGLVGNNVFFRDAEAGAWWTPFYVLTLVGRCVGLVGMLAFWPRPLARAERTSVIVGVAVAAIVSLLAFFRDGSVDWAAIEAVRNVPTPYPWVVVSDQILLQASGSLAFAFLLALPLRYLKTAPHEHRIRRQLAWAIVVVITLASGGSFLIESTLLGATIPFTPYGLLPILGSVILWLWATRHDDGRPARNAALAITGLLLVGVVIQAIAPRPSLLESTAIGIERTLFAFLIAYGILRLGFLGYEPQRRTAKRGTIAMGAVALVLIVAQVAQNFLAAQYGLLMGGVVAGAFLFAAQPLQRAIERMGAGDRAPAPTVAPRGQAAAEESYLLALRLALRDRVLSRDEERGLVVLAHDLGIPPRRAHELQDQVEREGRTKGGP